jgi:hypothetical protein
VLSFRLFTSNVVLRARSAFQRHDDGLDFLMGLKNRDRRGFVHVQKCTDHGFVTIHISGHFDERELGRFMPGFRG